ncbi:PREDICTED: 50S ribosomal protein L15, chloroplastic-like [Nelumbo nucifera]|uniref:50S ribosomal protein L15, chloroplastic-like n=2 Tax=Nelumbo nucifera TaxID=4432 RepID=A0A1U8AEA2_NELNU|nr:PREDICTED: 50S ribosomal protein L15, chloroplastic-like [Nelumbo nucifera]DAD35356.1 TPA_asm: hypothetical protein HUJ06_005996 [Nelumbo nucifera]
MAYISPSLALFAYSNQRRELPFHAIQVFLRQAWLKFHHSKRKEGRPLLVLGQVSSSSASVLPGPDVRLRLDSLGPQPGSRKRNKRKGKGISAGQGSCCGFGMRGQKSRSGTSVCKGFEGSQMPLYRHIPKLKRNGRRTAHAPIRNMVKIFISVCPCKFKRQRSCKIRR